MNLPEEMRRKALNSLPDLVESLRRDHYYITDSDTDEGGQVFVYDLCECGDDWPCSIAALILAYDEAHGE